MSAAQTETQHVHSPNTDNPLKIVTSTLATQTLVDVNTSMDPVQPPNDQTLQIK